MAITTPLPPTTFTNTYHRHQYIQPPPIHTTTTTTYHHHHHHPHTPTPRYQVYFPLNFLALFSNTSLPSSRVPRNPAPFRVYSTIPASASRPLTRQDYLPIQKGPSPPVSEA